MKRLLAAMVAALLMVALVSSSALAVSSKAFAFKSSGSGTEVAAASGCQFTLAGCTVVTNGTATSSHLGSGPYTSSLTINWAAATSNGAGGYCAPASGTQSLTVAANGDTLTQTQTGTVCEVGATGSNVPHTFTGTFTITGGTGRFAAASGSGTVTGGDNGQGTSFFSETGTLAY
jgi:hypothetical protein